MQWTCCWEAGKECTFPRDAVRAKCSRQSTYQDTLRMWKTTFEQKTYFAKFEGGEGSGFSTPQALFFDARARKTSRAAAFQSADVPSKGKVDGSTKKGVVLWTGRPNYVWWLLRRPSWSNSSTSSPFQRNRTGRVWGSCVGMKSQQQRTSGPPTAPGGHRPTPPHAPHCVDLTLATYKAYARVSLPLKPLLPRCKFNAGQELIKAPVAYGLETK